LSIATYSKQQKNHQGQYIYSRIIIGAHLVNIKLTVKVGLPVAGEFNALPDLNVIFIKGTKVFMKEGSEFDRRQAGICMCAFS
jgi:hypothetical protein